MPFLQFMGVLYLQIQIFLKKETHFFRNMKIQHLYRKQDKDVTKRIQKRTTTSIQRKLKDGYINKRLSNTL